ncbi:DUF1015 domain-containing protein [Treponema primitia]|uniref:DUF1015 domain-containing protein n=1 Tax=Treponema primitia TaxID=88058 RepID=UPI00025557E1|nr:DUF1015 domain-containing protein [Treponema primitia]
MTDSKRRLAALGTMIPEITLPGGDVDLEKWAVIACDQFTQDRSYWEDVRKTAAPSPSALNMIFPEVYLDDAGREDRIRNIHRTMASYLADGVLAPLQQGCIYIERSTPHHQRRRGLVLAIDLEHYDWKPGSQRLIRATEGTVPERIPPRMEVRRSAPLETPHILLLIDDETDYLIPALGERAKKGDPLYHTPLMLGAGEISGWALDTETDWMVLTEGLEELAGRSKTRYGGGNPFLYAVGDGNHSLATAKAVWEEYKQAHTGEGGLEQHPARYALVELENIYDPGIAFEPIHRVIFGSGLEEIRAALSELPGFSSHTVASPAELSQLVTDTAAGNRYGLIGEGRYILVETETTGIATEGLQPLLDRVISDTGRDGGPVIDYIHGEKELFRIADGEKPAVGERPVTGILLPPVKKAGLFQTVARSGPLPRKSFSMGEALEKRFYLECRKLFD